jgi:hypothetical protein
MVPRFVTPRLREKFGSIVPVYCVIRIGGPVPCDLPADARMVPSDTAAYFSQGKTGNRQMTDHISFFCGKMMVGHDGLLFWYCVGRASLYQKTRHVLYIILRGAL